eukprot:gnl/Chilomastix_caulleri/6652.p1 GENE.gnl/Chilomastix_caulleri/6652~~gnl/Chilomastix_caulleri/6652.p1  ORF type:complete len:86 (+),score=35.35 gnl/Chilomastix_caulleri/6652:166-423(+)
MWFHGRMPFLSVLDLGCHSVKERDWKEIRINMPRKQESGVTDKNPDRQERHSAMKPHSKGGKGDDKPDRVYEDEEEEVFGFGGLF